MTIRDFVRREGVLDPATLTRDTWDAIEEALTEGPHELEQIVELLPQGVADLPYDVIHAVASACARHFAWQERRREFVAARAGEGLPALPESATDATFDEASLATLATAAEVLPRERFAGEEAWSKGLVVALDLWNRTLDSVRQYGRVRAVPVAGAEPAPATDGDEGGQPVGDTWTPINTLSAPQWLVMSVALRRGAATIELDVSTAALEEGWERFALLLRDATEHPEDPIAEAPSDEDSEVEEQDAADDAGEAAAEEAATEEAATEEVAAWPTATTEELAAVQEIWQKLTPSLPDALSQRLDEVATRRILDVAVRAYGGLLSAPPLNAPRVGAVYIGSGARVAIGLAIVGRDGNVMSTARIAPTEGWTDRVKAWLRAEDARHIVVPARSDADAELQELRQALGGRRTVVTIRSAAIDEAREALLAGRKRMTPEAAAAAALALRAVRPSQAWMLVDPTALELAEGQSDIVSDRLAGELALTRTIFAHRVRQREARFTAGQAAAAGEKWDHPVIRSMTDLKTGMVVPAVVTNITRFGAFVDLGLSHQGLIHISDLADHFVRDPAEVVRSGQQVRARVLNVDVGRGRISLTLRSENRPPQQRPRGARPGGSEGGPSRFGPSGSSRPGGSGPPRSGSTPGDRQKALRDLDKLFDR